MVSEMFQAKWPEEHVKALGTFYIALQHHERLREPNGKVILIAYAARARKEWYAKVKDEEMFDISEINETLLKQVSDEFYRNESDRGLAEVCCYHQNYKNPN